MSEQQGQAAGTAEPETTPAINLHKPWKRFPGAPRLVVDSTGAAITNVAPPYMLRGIADEVHEEVARHIVACVNFCGELSTELLEELAAGHYKISISRICLDKDAPSIHFDAVQHRDPTLRQRLSDARESFARDVRNGHARLAGALPGGAI